jgi:IclR family transcriptional regulator, KDG regulon repressor
MTPPGAGAFRRGRTGRRDRAQREEGQRLLTEQPGLSGHGDEATLFAMDTAGTSSVHRAVAILTVLGSEDAAERGGLGVVEIARRVGREKTQISRALRVLQETGLVERDPGSLGYRLGWRLFTMAASVGRQQLLVHAPPVLRRLVSATKERGHLTVLHGAGALTLLSESPLRAVQTVGWVGRVTPLHNTSSGRALLFDHHDETVADLLAGTCFEGAGPGAPRDIAEVLDRLHRDRCRGYALADEEFEEGLIAVGAPVRDGCGRIVAALNLSAPKFRLGRDIDTAARMTCAAARRVSEALAGRGPTAPAVRAT